MPLVQKFGKIVEVSADQFPPPDPNATRNNAAIERAEFCNNLAAAGILTDSDAIKGAQGFWPDAMISFLDYLDATQRRDVQIEWATVLTIRRMHPFVLSLGSWLGLTDAQVDTLFGITEG